MPLEISLCHAFISARRRRCERLVYMLTDDIDADLKITLF